MVVETETDIALNESFRAALVLTGSLEGAEHVVGKAIAALESDCSEDALLVETARSAVQHWTFSAEAPSFLPLELQALSALSPISRCCFVMRVLMDLDFDTCAEILRLSSQEVEDAVRQSCRDLPRAVGTLMVLRQSQHRFLH